MFQFTRYHNNIIHIIKVFIDFVANLMMFSYSTRCRDDVYILQYKWLIYVYCGDYVIYNHCQSCISKLYSPLDTALVLISALWLFTSIIAGSESLISQCGSNWAADNTTGGSVTVDDSEHPPYLQWNQISTEHFKAN